VPSAPAPTEVPKAAAPRPTAPSGGAASTDRGAPHAERAETQRALAALYREEAQALATVGALPNAASSLHAAMELHRQADALIAQAALSASHAARARAGEPVPELPSVDLGPYLEHQRVTAMVVALASAVPADRRGRALAAQREAQDLAAKAAQIVTARATRADWREEQARLLEAWRAGTRQADGSRAFAWGDWTWWKEEASPEALTERAKALEVEAARELEAADGLSATVAGVEARLRAFEARLAPSGAMTR